jgi:peptide/nickel transport system permease protein
MFKLIRNRLAISIPMLFLVTALVFILQSFLPGDAAKALAGLTATEEAVQALRVEMNLDKPLPVQYWLWLSGLFRGTLGRSLSNREPVVDALKIRLPVSLSLVTLATLVSALLGVALGLVSSYGGKTVAAIADILSILGMSVPGFWLSLMLISVFSVSLGWLPSMGYVTLAESAGGWIKSLILPVVGISFSGMTSIAKQTRQAMLEALNTDFVRNLRANGIRERSIVLKHCLRNAALPAVTTAGLLFIGLLGGAVIAEQIFGLPGLGSLAVIATGSNDIPLIQGVTLSFTLIVIGMNLVVDIVYGLLNPKVRHG